MRGLMHSKRHVARFAWAENGHQHQWSLVLHKSTIDNRSKGQAALQYTRV
jgi:hypothetical protein